MLSRKITAFGLSPMVGYALFSVVFVSVSTYLFSKTEYAVYLYGLIALSYASKLSEPRRNDFLKTIFSKSDYLKVRALENLFFVFPFLAFMAYEGLYFYTTVLAVLSVSLALFNFNTNISYTIPTPFGKKPFEFLVSFRKTFFIIPAVYLLIYLAIVLSNFNIGIFAMVMMCVLALSYYSKPENEYFVWNYNLSPKQFLIEKIKTGFLHFSLLFLPAAIVLAIFFVDEIHIVGIFSLLCYAYLATMVLAKYAAFPDEMNLSQGILFVMSFMMPPILVVVMPYFYSQSVKKLNVLLK